jgi:redox-sensing transcriptional repressor
MEINQRKVPEVVVKRLPRYYRYLSELDKKDISRISSNALSEMMNVTASQIRQDLNCFGGFGQQGYGYNVKQLRDEIGSILGLYDGDTMIIVGAGNMGRALANHETFGRRGFKLMGIFDADEKVIGTSVCGFEVMSSANIVDFVKENKIDIAILALPSSATEETAQVLVKSGIRGIMNFSYCELNVPDTIPVENIHLSDPLMTLAYRIKGRK